MPRHVGGCGCPGSSAPTVSFCGCPAIPETLDGYDRAYSQALSFSILSPATSLNSACQSVAGSPVYRSGVYPAGTRWARAYMCCSTGNVVGVYRVRWSTQAAANSGNVQSGSPIIDGPPFLGTTGVLNSCDPFDYEGTTVAIDVYE